MALELPSKRIRARKALDSSEMAPSDSATHALMAGSASTEDPEATLALKHEFETLATRWLADTRHLSIVNAKIVHPAYLQIIGMGPISFTANLKAIAQTDPAPEGASPARFASVKPTTGSSTTYPHY